VNEGALISVTTAEMHFGAYVGQIESELFINFFTFLLKFFTILSAR